MLHDAMVSKIRESSREAVEEDYPGAPSREEELAEETHEQALNRVEKETLRDAGKRYITELDKYAFYILNHHNPFMATWVVSYALGLKPAWGKTLDDIARICAVGTRQTICKEVKRFCAATGYPPSLAMKCKKAGAAYREARIQSIIENQEEE